MAFESVLNAYPDARIHDVVNRASLYGPIMLLSTVIKEFVQKSCKVNLAKIIFICELSVFFLKLLRVTL